MIETGKYSTFEGLICNRNYHDDSSLEARLSSLETRLPSREKQDKTGNLLLSGTVSCTLSNETKLGSFASSDIKVTMRFVSGF